MQLGPGITVPVLQVAPVQEPLARHATSPAHFVGVLHLAPLQMPLAMHAPSPAQAVTITQKGCQYLPHVVPMVVNQELKVVNADSNSHNIHPLAKINHEWNKSQPPGTPPFSEKFDKPEFIPVKCNIHPWMHGEFAVLKNSHYAVSGGDGSFSLPNLPPGKYTLTAWHESYGEQTQDVTISGNETKTISFVFKAKPY